MRHFTSLLGLPASLLLLVTAHAGDAQAGARGLPTAIRKMPPDAGEKLLREYLAFVEVEVEMGGDELLAVNASAPVAYLAPLAPHFSPELDTRGGTGGDGGEEEWSGWDIARRAWDVVARLEKRGYACPTGTSDCSLIGYPNSCCQTGTECVQITDTGLGPVGCCPDGVSCSGSIACSGSQEGCPSDIGGGCCIEGYVCASVGCVQSAAATTTTTLQTSTVVVTVGGSPTTTVTTLTVPQPLPTSTSTSNTASTSPEAQTTTITSSTSSSKTEPSSSPTATTQTSTTTSSQGTTTSPTSPSAPVRPTSISTTTTSASTTPADYCPTGFYACSAVYGGGCCQTGRDCQTASCPSTASTAVISAVSGTIAVPLTAVPSASTTSACAAGWSLCPSGAGATAGCCPAGYSCGTASCFLATGSATVSVAKELTGSGAVRGEVGMVGLVMIQVVFGFAFGMVWT
ncbi:hypothetical protein VSDG_04288 [Cytospora chrysosperma]|uniref:GPI anchored protein n=1 Tax=Cytospora chrysosperma TaxID=252740 RepID=A0A423W5E7_CYTCH|nr:hypothetical protein VSDG_04288 [Valsa sordida]